MSKIDEQILQLLKESGPLTLAEIAEKLGKKPKVVFRSLRRLFEKNEITGNTQTRQYALSSK
jgi:DNA-binding Lrp family transcriptional regulator